MRILAPLLVLSVLGLVALRWLADPRRQRDRVWIEGAWDLAVHRTDVKERLTARLEDDLARHGEDPETRWFAARAWLKIGELDRALDAVWGDPALAAAPGTAHRLRRPPAARPGVRRRRAARQSPRGRGHGVAHPGRGRRRAGRGLARHDDPRPHAGRLDGRALRHLPLRHPGRAFQRRPGVAGARGAPLGRRGVPDRRGTGGVSRALRRPGAARGDRPARRRPHPAAHRLVHRLRRARPLGGRPRARRARRPPPPPLPLAGRGGRRTTQAWSRRASSPPDGGRCARRSPPTWENAASGPTWGSPGAGPSCASGTPTRS